MTFYNDLTNISRRSLSKVLSKDLVSRTANLYIAGAGLCWKYHPVPSQQTLSAANGAIVLQMKDSKVGYANLSKVRVVICGGVRT